MDTTFALSVTPSKLVSVCSALGALPGLVHAVDGIGTLLHIHAAAGLGSVASTLSVLGILRIVPIAYARYARSSTRTGNVSAIESDGG